MAMLLLQVALLAFLCVRKAGYHIDEIYSYVLSNSYRADRFSNAEGLKGRWLDGGEALGDFASVQPGERFAYGRTYANNVSDAHPPLYYYVLHTVCSFFPGVFNKWLGLSVNLVSFVLTQLLLFWASCAVFKRDLWKLLPAALYGFSPVAADTVLFIRMYALLTLLTVALFCVHVKLLRGRFWPNCLLCFLLVFLGTYTHFFFAVAAFYLAAAFCVYLLGQKRFKQLAVYAFAMLAGVALVFAVYPAAFTQITGSSTNNVGNEVSSNILRLNGLPDRLWSYWLQFMGRMAPEWSWLTASLAVLGLAAALSAAVRKKIGPAQTTDGTDHQFLFPLIAVLLLTAVTSAHLAGRFVFIRYVFDLMPLVFFAFILLCDFLCQKCRAVKKLPAIGLMIVSLLLGVQTAVTQNCGYLFTQQAQSMEAAEAFIEGKPLIVADKNSNRLITANYTLLTEVKRMYITDTDAFSLDGLLGGEDTSHGAVLLVLTDTYWGDGYNGDETVEKLVDASSRFTRFDIAGWTPYATLYWVR